MTHPIFDQLYNIGAIPVLEIDSATHARPLVEALSAGGLPIAEITLRTEAALESIRVIAREVPDIIVGAGTVVTWEQAEMARDAGAQFLVSPGKTDITLRAGTPPSKRPQKSNNSSPPRVIHCGFTSPSRLAA